MGSLYSWFSKSNKKEPVLVVFIVFLVLAAVQSAVL